MSEVKQYQTRKTVIEAIQFNSDEDLEAIQEFTGADNFSLVAEEDRNDDPDMRGQIFDKLHNTWVHVYYGQWIIKGTEGEFYPCAGNVFLKKYEEVKE